MGRISRQNIFWPCLKHNIACLKGTTCGTIAFNWNST